MSSSLKFRRAECERGHLRRARRLGDRRSRRIRYVIAEHRPHELLTAASGLRTADGGLLTVDLRLTATEPLSSAAGATPESEIGDLDREVHPTDDGPCVPP